MFNSRSKLTSIDSLDYRTRDTGTILTVRIAMRAKTPAAMELEINEK